MTAHAERSSQLGHGLPAKRAGMFSIGMGLPVAVYALVIASFAMGADEFIVAGVIEEISRSLGVSLGAVGQLESAYAVGVAIGALTRWPRAVLSGFVARHQHARHVGFIAAVMVVGVGVGYAATLVGA